MLTREEKAWIRVRFFLLEWCLSHSSLFQDHNKKCYDRLVPLLQDDSRALRWLKRESERGIGVVDGPGGLQIDWD